MVTARNQEPNTLETFSRIAVVVSVLTVVCARNVAAQALTLSKSDCGSPPEQFALNESSDTKLGGGFSGIFKQGAAKGDFERAVTKTRQAVYAHYPDAKDLDRQQYADYLTCIFIITDPDLNGAGRRKAWYEYLRSKGQPVKNSSGSSGIESKPIETGSAISGNNSTGQPADTNEMFYLNDKSIPKWVIKYEALNATEGTKVEDPDPDSNIQPTDPAPPDSNSVIISVSPEAKARQDAFDADYERLLNQGVDNIAVFRSEHGFDNYSYILAYGYKTRPEAVEAVHQFESLAKSLGRAPLDTGSIEPLNLQTFCEGRHFANCGTGSYFCTDNEKCP